MVVMQLIWCWRNILLYLAWCVVLSRKVLLEFIDCISCQNLANSQCQLWTSMTPLLRYLVTNVRLLTVGVYSFILCLFIVGQNGLFSRVDNLTLVNACKACTMSSFQILSRMTYIIYMSVCFRIICLMCIHFQYPQTHWFVNLLDFLAHPYDATETWSNIVFWWKSLLFKLHQTHRMNVCKLIFGQKVTCPPSDW